MSPVPDEGAPPCETKSRLVINQIVMENFKSYAGRQIIGPFHKSFTSIVGPNGSGKSNVIDAFMFVLGFRAKKMRQTKLSELIHASQGQMSIESCTVEVHFHLIIDKEDGEADIVPGSEIVVSRTAYRNSRNLYHVNGQVKSAAEVTSLLKGYGVDLDHNRFLILQGEVELIAQMKPKGSTEHEEGLLEYLEDIIGTSDYIKQIEDVAKAMELAAEAFTEKQVRVRAASRECEGLVGEKDKAEAFLRQENTLVELRSQKNQGLLHKKGKDSEAAGQRLGLNKEKLETERTKFAAEKEQIDQLSTAIEGKEKLVNEGEVVVKDLSKDLAKLEAEDVRMQETRKHLKNKIKGSAKSQSDLKKQRSGIERDLESTNLELKGVVEQIETLEASRAHEETELEKICKSLQGVTGKYQSQIDEKQAQLAPLQDKIRKEQQSLELATSSRDLLQQKSESSGRQLAEVQERIGQIEEELKLAREDKERLEDESERLKRQMEGVGKEREKVRIQAASLEKEVDILAATVLEAKESLTAATTGGTILTSLIKEKRAGRLPGVHGRLGDLGTIDAKYDTAISTACGFLNHIVVDTTETGQKCIEFLRKHSLGRANFIILDKMRPAKAAQGLPSGAQRLFDLVKAKQQSLYKDAFYFALNETLVADGMEQASQWAYHSGSRRFRVVTLDGRLIETSGTISGGGRPQRGGMKATSAADGVTLEQVEQLQVCLNEQRNTLRQFNARIAELESERQSLLDKQSRTEALLIKAETLCSSLPEELADLEGQLPKLQQASKKLSASDQKKMESHLSEINLANDQISKLKAEMAPIEAAIAAIQAQIMEAGGIKFKLQKCKVDGLKEQIEHLSGRSKKLSGDKAVMTARIEALDAGHKDPKADEYEAELKRVEGRIEENTQSALDLRQQLDKASQELDLIREERDDLSKQMALLEKEHSRFKKIEYDLRVKIEQDEEIVAEAARLSSRLHAELQTLRLHHIDLAEAAPVLTLYEDESDLAEICKTLDTLEQQCRILAEKLHAANPNLRVLQEYREKESRLRVLEGELQKLDEERQTSRDLFDTLRQRRHDEFMTGLRLISARLKDLYHLITLGGMAELELVDSLDPFSEGILFSVMPPRKSWKTIANLSGGEKTLSSLALLFALHTYRPTPIYVMDEIDAALDFRNVSIVAHYIKERTRDAQFVVISLRNDMFELADRLVGIYKTEQRTKSVTIDPHRFSLPSTTTTTITQQQPADNA